MIEKLSKLSNCNVKYFLAITDFAQFGSTLENYLTNVNKTLLVCGFGQFDHTRQKYMEPQCADMYIKAPEVCNLKINSNMLCGYWDNKDNNGKVI